MSNLQFLSSFLEMRRRQNLSRKEILDIQKAQFSLLLQYVWENSSFYRNLYQSHGIKKTDLPELTSNDLPFTSKEILMENFDEAVTDKRLKRPEIEKWLEKKDEKETLYKNEYKVIHSSGTSGKRGIFIYDQKGWNTLKAAVMTRVSSPNLNPLKKTRLAFFATTNGRFAGASLAADAPKLLYEAKIFSIFDSLEETIKQLNQFQPDQMSGYASTIGLLAEEANKGKLNISPKRVIVSGDPLTEEIENMITKVWRADIINMYASSESIAIAARLSNQKQLQVFDDMHIIEILDDQQKQVKPNESGHISLTNLYNFSLPLIRYQMHDMAIPGEIVGQFNTIQKILGRSNDALPVLLDNKKIDYIHPLILNRFHIDKLKKIQFISKKPDNIEIKYVAEESLDKAIENKIKEYLKLKNAAKMTKVVIHKIDTIANDPKTGKFKLVIK